MSRDAVIQCPPHNERARKQLESRKVQDRWLREKGPLVSIRTSKLWLMANTTIVMKGPLLPGTVPEITRIPAISGNVGTVHDMDQYIDDPAGLVTSTRMLENGSLLASSIISYNAAFRRVEFNSAGTVDGLQLEITW